jgi:hypothetical protein
MCIVGLLWVNGIVFVSSAKGVLETPGTLSLDGDGAIAREAIA